MSKHILIVDDSKFTRKMVALPLEREGFRVTTKESPSEAVGIVQNDRPDLVITDLKMPTLMEGLGFLKLLGLEQADLPVFVYSADPDPRATVGETGLATIRFIKKPVAPEVLRQEIDLVLAQG